MLLPNYLWAGSTENCSSFLEKFIHLQQKVKCLSQLAVAHPSSGWEHRRSSEAAKASWSSFGTGWTGKGLWAQADGAVCLQRHSKVTQGGIPEKFPVLGVQGTFPSTAFVKEKDLSRKMSQFCKTWVLQHHVSFYKATYKPRARPCFSGKCPKSTLQRLKLGI